jgi:site-specific recombinase XerD
MADLSDYPVTTSKSRERLNERQLIDYREERRACLTWLLTFGKDPQQVIGYAPSTVKSRSARMDMFYRFVWEHEGTYTINVTHGHADDWMNRLAERDDIGVTHQRNCVKAMKMLFKWRHHEHGLDEWDPPFTFSREPATQPRDYLTREERRTIRAAALDYGAVPSYNNTTPTERDRVTAYLAQRFEKPKAEVTPADWERANG